MSCPDEITGSALFEKWAYEARYFIDRAMSLPPVPKGSYCWNYGCRSAEDMSECPIGDACAGSSTLSLREKARRISVHGNIYKWLSVNSLLGERE